MEPCRKKTMKRLLSLILLLSLVGHSYSQEWTDNKKIVSFGYGVGGSNLLTHSSYSFEEINDRNSLNIEYLRRFSNSFCFGGSFAYHIQTGETIDGHNWFDWDSCLESFYLNVHAADNCISLSAIVRYYYYQGRRFSFYSQGGIGLKQSFIRYTGSDVGELEKKKESGLFPTYQFYIAGIEAGNAKWRFFYQIGLSGSGISQLGLRYGL